uniref:Major facilitator superfamily (MFS) profile domain-containing protein n=1 Tax=Stomoxys calcitrans TaxID=35570 RepID=A0A1I8NLW8_STOCA
MGEIQARTVLWHVIFVGFAINYLVIINLNIAIVEMVAPTNHHNASYLESSAAKIRIDKTEFNNLRNITFGKINGSTYQMPADVRPSQSKLKEFTEEDKKLQNKLEKFQWNEHQQALALGSFFWLHWLTQIPGGILAKKYGTKLIFGLSNVITCWICMLIPLVSYMDLKALLVLRIIQGLLSGLSWPAMHSMTAKWIPPNERSKFITSYFGSAVGVAVAFPLFGCIIHWLWWPWVFYITTIVGTVWWLAWLYFAYDTPAQHPRISAKELTHIEKALGNTIGNHQTLKIPWKDIFTSRPVWMNVIGQWGGAWIIFTVMTQAPTYFKVIHDWDIRAAGVFSGIPHLLRMIFAYFFSLLADYLLRNDKLSRTNVRKLATGISCILNGLMMLSLALLGTNRILAITFICLATMFQGSGTSGPLSSMIDIAPNFAGIISGLCGTIGCMPGFLSAFIVGYLTLNNQTFEAWTNVFLVAAAVLCGCGFLYVCFADSTLQKWNDNQASTDEDKREQLMKEDTERKIS